MSRNAWWILGGLLLVVAFGYQSHRISNLTKEVAEVRAEISAPPPGAELVFKDGPSTPERSASITPNDQPVHGIQARLANLERGMNELSKVSQILSARGMIPPSEEKIAELQQKIFDPAATEEERVQALRLLRRGDSLSNDVLLQALNTLQSSTNLNIRREIISQFNGLTNAALKQPLMALLDTETSDPAIRQQLVSALRRFTDDPAVETKMWDLALNDPNMRVQNEAREALTRGPATPGRVDDLKTRATNPNASLDERLIAFRGLRLAKSHTPEIVSEFASLAASATDPVSRAKLFKSFNGLTDEYLMAPLVTGLQDPDPIVRQSAADSLSSFPDPRVQEWHNHLIQTDADPTVKREAHAALEHSQRVSRQPQAQTP